MPAVSLVFALVVGLWAAYLLPQWVRRRDTLGHARVHDRHSERLRVLPRRRPARVASGPSSRPLLTGTSVAVTGPPVRAGARAQGRPKPLPAAPAARRDDVVEAPARVAARRRAAVLLTLVAATAASWALVLVPAVGAPLWEAAPATGLLLLDLVALRSAARRRASRAMARRRAERIERIERIGREAAAAADAAAAAPAARPRTVRPAGSSARAAATASGRSATSRPARPARPAAPVVAAAASSRPDWDDRRWEDETGEIVGIERPNPLAADGWEPVPVPTPTYMSKPVVERPKPRPWTPERDFADDLDLDAVLARRRAVNG